MRFKQYNQPQASPQWLLGCLLVWMFQYSFLQSITVSIALQWLFGVLFENDNKLQLWTSVLQDSGLEQSMGWEWRPSRMRGKACPPQPMQWLVRCCFIAGLLLLLREKLLSLIWETICTSVNVRNCFKRACLMYHDPLIMSHDTWATEHRTSHLSKTLITKHPTVETSQPVLGISWFQ